jgi:hypothetical protein
MGIRDGIDFFDKYGHHSYGSRGRNHIYLKALYLRGYNMVIRDCTVLLNGVVVYRGKSRVDCNNYMHLFYRDHIVLKDSKLF